MIVDYASKREITLSIVLKQWMIVLDANINAH